MRTQFLFRFQIIVTSFVNQSFYVKCATEQVNLVTKHWKFWENYSFASYSGWLASRPPTSSWLNVELELPLSWTTELEKCKLGPNLRLPPGLNNLPTTEIVVNIFLKDLWISRNCVNYVLQIFINFLHIFSLVAGSRLFFPARYLLSLAGCKSCNAGCENHDHHHTRKSDPVRWLLSSPVLSSSSLRVTISHKTVETCPVCEICWDQ